jgi:hypothetical protein
MSARILVQEGKGRAPLTPAPETAWSLLSGVGWLFSVVAAADLVLAWYPTNFGNASGNSAPPRQLLNTSRCWLLDSRWSLGRLWRAELGGC